MERVYLQYAPATTRNLMARVGAYVTVDVDGEKYRLSPHEMPGEIEWRIDFIRWLIFKTFLYVSPIPPRQRMGVLLRAEDQLIRSTNLHPFEARAVVAGTLWSLVDWPEAEGWVLDRGKPLVDACIQTEGEELMGRYRALVKQYGRKRGPESLEQNSDTGPSNWNWSQFFD
jgi:hypothetical protein